jgi:hypothetical protein
MGIELRVSDVVNLNDWLSILGRLRQRIVSPWAILLVRFSDDTDPLPPLTKYQDLFTSAGSGSLNMVDFFSDMSHGKLDLSGSQVFGWYTLPAKRGDYVGNVYPQPNGKLNRNGLVDLARATASAAGVNLGSFAGVVVSGLGAVDLCGWVGGMTALCDSYSLTPSLLGQEMGHGYGLDHARLQGSDADYQDPWDVMSTAAYPWMQAAHPEFTTVGPGLNAWSMRSREWLDEMRVWSSSYEGFDETIQLRPLHRADLSGYLAAELGPYLIEFRVPERWDAAIPRACVLVHRFENNHSYLMPAQNGSQDMVEGDRFVVGNPANPFANYYSAEVTHIDPQNLVATIHLVKQPAHPPHIPDLVGQIFGGVSVDGGGFILVGHKIIKIPPRGPAFALVQHVVRYLEASTAANGVDITLASQRQALESIVSAAIDLHAEAEAVSEPPPGYLKQTEETYQTNGLIEPSN